MSRSNPMPWLAGGSIAALAILVALLYLEVGSPESAPATRPIRVYCAAALRPALLAIAADYARETGERVECEFGDSGKMLGQVTIRKDGDLFLPADDSYVRLAEAKGLVGRTIPLCRMHAVILTRPGNPFRIAALDDLLRPDLKLGIANPDRAAIGKVVRDHLTSQGRWDALAARIDVQHVNVTDAANAVQIGSRDATFVWDAVAVNYPELATIQILELEGAIGRVELALLAHAPNAAAAGRFARYMASSNGGLAQLRKFGLMEVEP